jgi:hypothetical protein
MLGRLVVCLLIGVASSAFPRPDATGGPCPRVRAARVRALATEFFRVPLDTLPAACPLATANDRYAAQEASKVMIYQSQWKCGFCSKMFKSQMYLNMHLDAKHEGEIPQVTSCHPAAPARPSPHP